MRDCLGRCLMYVRSYWTNCYRAMSGNLPPNWLNANRENLLTYSWRAVKLVLWAENEL